MALKFKLLFSIAGLKMRLFVIAILLSSSSVAYKNLDWKILEKYMIKISSSPRNYGIDSNHIPVLYEHDISHDHDKSSTRKMGFFTTMFPGSSQPHLNYTDEDEGTPLFLTPLLEQGKIDIARDLARVRNLSDIESYSGFLTVNKKYDSNLFFWYVPSKVSIG